MYDQNFYGRAGVVDREGGNTERCWKWGGERWRSLRNLYQNNLELGGG